MLSSSAHQETKYRNREIEYQNNKNVTASGSCSPEAKCQFCEFIESSHWNSGSEDLSVPQSACAICASEPPASRQCQASERRKGPQPPVCVDPNCSENICEECAESVCDECSNHVESCEDCIGRCVTDCRISLCSDGPDCGVQDGYSFDDTYFELFGNQAAQVFDLNGRLPQLPLDTVPATLADTRLYQVNAGESPIAENEASEYFFGSHDKLGFSSAPTQSHTQHPSLEAAKPTYLDGSIAPATESAFLEEWNPLFLLDIEVPHTQGTTSAYASSFRSSDSKQIDTHKSPTTSQLHAFCVGDFTPLTQDKAAVLASTDRSLPRKSDVVQRRRSRNSSTCSSVRCQWANSNGQPCSNVFQPGSDLHEHLRTAHGVNREVFCRWIGCRFGVDGTTPHKYANSVERHTWGHSGYRPYKCPTCSEGFSAAIVRDEHFANFHLKRKMFSCDICTHQCSSARNLKRHKDDTHKTERFQCEFCNRSGKLRLFPRGSNLARHFRKCKYVLALFPEAINTTTGKIDDDWFPPGYRGGHQGMDKAKVMPPNYLPVPDGRMGR